MSFSVTPFLRKLLAVLLLLGAAGAVWMLLVQPLAARFGNYGAEIDNDRALLSRLLTIAAGESDLQSRVAELRRLEAGRGGLLSGANPALAAAALQERVKKIVTAHRGTLKSVLNLPPEPEAGFLRVPLSVSLISDTEALRNILYDVESSTPFLFVDEMDVRQQLVRYRAAHASRDEDSEERNANVELQVRLRISGYLRPGEG